MKVVYKRTISQQLDDAISNAIVLNKKIKYIELTFGEARELAHECGTPSLDISVQNTYRGIPIKVK